MKFKLFEIVWEYSKRFARSFELTVLSWYFLYPDSLAWPAFGFCLARIRHNFAYTSSLQIGEIFFTSYYTNINCGEKKKYGISIRGYLLKIDYSYSFMFTKRRGLGLWDIDLFYLGGLYKYIKHKWAHRKDEPIEEKSKKEDNVKWVQLKIRDYDWNWKADEVGVVCKEHVKGIRNFANKKTTPVLYYSGLRKSEYEDGFTKFDLPASYFNTVTANKASFEFLGFINSNPHQQDADSAVVYVPETKYLHISRVPTDLKALNTILILGLRGYKKSKDEHIYIMSSHITHVSFCKKDKKVYVHKYGKSYPLDREILEKIGKRLEGGTLKIHGKYTNKGWR